MSKIVSPYRETLIDVLPVPPAPSRLRWPLALATVEENLPPLCVEIVINFLEQGANAKARQLSEAFTTLHRDLRRVKAVR